MVPTSLVNPPQAAPTGECISNSVFSYMCVHVERTYIQIRLQIWFEKSGPGSRVLGVPAFVFRGISTILESGRSVDGLGNGCRTCQEGFEFAGTL
jgi:hypothetical protein